MHKAKFNLNLIVALAVLIIVGYSFVSSPTGFLVLGQPATKLCTDSDGENNLVRGSCFDNSGEKKVDRCVDFNTAEETYCSPSNQCSYKFKNCPYGYQCAGGACVKLY